jgi:hypothetical protein
MMTTKEVGCLRPDVGRQKAEVGKEQGRDTRMCGDPKTWFPMRVTYQREMKVKGDGSFWGLREGRTNWLAVHG